MDCSVDQRDEQKDMCTIMLVSLRI